MYVKSIIFLPFSSTAVAKSAVVKDKTGKGKELKKNKSIKSRRLPDNRVNHTGWKETIVFVDMN